MNEQAKKNQRPDFLAGEPTADAIRKQFLEAPMAAAQQPAIDIGLEVLTFMAALPGAFVASEERELNRLSRVTEASNDPRMERLKVSIARAMELRAASRQGKVRIDRALVSLSGESNVFHGFVSDGTLAPQKGLTVRITVSRDGAKETTVSSTVTNADGYFSISLDRESGRRRREQTPDSNVKGSERMAERPARANVKSDAGKMAASAAAPGDGDEILAQVDILDAKTNVIHEDPAPIVVNAGTVYREYVIENKEGRTEKARYAGNPATHEFHDTQNLSKRCHVDAIEPSPLYFSSTEDAEKAGYRHCAYCLGKTKSKR